jgi:hypothetical protein
MTVWVVSGGRFVDIVTTRLSSGLALPGGLAAALMCLLVTPGLVPILERRRTP